MIEAVATKIAERIGTQQFRLIQWAPHLPLGQRYSEVLLDPVPPSPVPHGHTYIGDGDQWHTTDAHTITVRFANPRWRPLSDRQLVALLGQTAVYELYAMAGIKGDYTPQRLFGNTGRQLVQEIHAHNDAQAEALIAQLREWGVR